MRVLLDTCVLYPTLLRRLLFGAASAGLYDALAAPRIFEEWARRAARDGAGDEAAIRAEIARLAADGPVRLARPRDGDLARLVLPDPDDVHVLAAAIAGSADAVLTFNARDFPRGALAAEGLSRLDPDLFLLRLRDEAPDAMGAVIDTVARDARAAGIAGDPPALLKRARLPRLARSLKR